MFINYSWTFIFLIIQPFSTGNVVESEDGVNSIGETMADVTSVTHPASKVSSDFKQQKCVESDLFCKTVSTLHVAHSSDNFKQIVFFHQIKLFFAARPPSKIRLFRGNP